MGFEIGLIAEFTLRNDHEAADADSRSSSALRGNRQSVKGQHQPPPRALEDPVWNGAGRFDQPFLSDSGVAYRLQEQLSAVSSPRPVDSWLG